MSSAALYAQYILTGLCGAGSMAQARPTVQKPGAEDTRNRPARRP